MDGLDRSISLTITAGEKFVIHGFFALASSNSLACIIEIGQGLGHNLTFKPGGRRLSLQAHIQKTILIDSLRHDLPPWCKSIAADPNYLSSHLPGFILLSTHTLLCKEPACHWIVRTPDSPSYDLSTSRFVETSGTSSKHTSNLPVSLPMLITKMIRFVSKPMPSPNISVCGAHLLLQIPTEVLNKELRSRFQHWYPDMADESALPLAAPPRSCLLSN